MIYLLYLLFYKSKNNLHFWFTQEKFLIQNVIGIIISLQAYNILINIINKINRKN